MKILAKIYKIWKYMKKCGLIHATITCTKQVECALWFQFRWAHHHSKEVGCLDSGLFLVGWYLGGPWYQCGPNNSSALHVHSVIFQLKTNIQQHLTKSTIWKNVWIIWTMVHINYLNMILLPKLRPRHWNS